MSDPDPELRRPTDRTCERCGREEMWRDGSWRVAEVDGERRVGSVYCVHEWDINGTFVPFDDGSGRPAGSA
ncbi:HEWD family protein [Halobium salinum]|uniref:HEWD family protein n=1 Tax=Halobium salinum TaxID=1364940 RepID=A0ABD5P6X5_9EURY|nr:HEWD family protein [Halobium salinum]